MTAVTPRGASSQTEAPCPPLQHDADRPMERLAAVDDHHGLEVAASGTPAQFSVRVKAKGEKPGSGRRATYAAPGR